MRLLFLTNFYPPAHLGGMELRLQEAVQGLGREGHQCQVLTSSFVPPDVALSDEPDVARVLTLEADVYHYHPLHYLLNRRAELRRNAEAFKRVAGAFRPDLVFFWGMWNLSPTLIATAAQMFPGRVVQSFGGYWPAEPDAHEAYWQAKNGRRWTDRLRRLIAPLALSGWYRPVHWSDITFQHAVFVSRYVQDYLCRAGLVFPHARVVFPGIATDEFMPSEIGTPAGTGLRVVCAGGWAEHKGADVAIEAIRLLDTSGVNDISLTVVGRGHPDERTRLDAMVHDARLQDRVHFRSALTRGEMPETLREHDVLVVPTLTPEPLGRIVMEGMACGLVVAASLSGGIPEMIDHGRDGFLFTPGNSGQLSNLLQQFAQMPDLRRQIGAEARATAVARFNIQRMVEDIEQFLDEVMLT